MDFNKKTKELREGDYVQIRSGEYAGRVGMIIGSKVREINNRWDLYYDVMFSDKESRLLPGMALVVARQAE